jgi:hypothetical protein
MGSCNSNHRSVGAAGMSDLSKLAARIRAQLEKEYPSPYDREYAFHEMTVKQLLEMLEYMGDEDE